MAPPPKKSQHAPSPGTPKPEESVAVDWNNPGFQGSLFSLDKAERLQVLKTVEKLLQLPWSQVYRDQGLKWELITSKSPPTGIEAFYSLRVSQGRRATAYRDGNFLRLLLIEPDHDATYGQK